MILRISGEDIPKSASIPELGRIVLTLLISDALNALHLNPELRLKPRRRLHIWFKGRDRIWRGLVDGGASLVGFHSCAASSMSGKLGLQTPNHARTSLLIYITFPDLLIAVPSPRHRADVVYS
jgi:hypothetical protein